MQLFERIHYKIKEFFHWSPLYWFLSPLKKNKIGLWTTGLKGLKEWEIFLPFHKLQLVKSLPFYWHGTFYFYTLPPTPMEWMILTGPYLLNGNSCRSLSHHTVWRARFRQALILYLWFLQVPYLPISTRLVVIQAIRDSDRPFWVNANTETLCCN